MGLVAFGESGHVLGRRADAQHHNQRLVPASLPVACDDVEQVGGQA